VFITDLTNGATGARRVANEAGKVGEAVARRKNEEETGGCSKTPPQTTPFWDGAINVEREIGAPIKKSKIGKFPGKRRPRRGAKTSEKLGGKTQAIVDTQENLERN